MFPLIIHVDIFIFFNDFDFAYSFNGISSDLILSCFSSTRKISFFFFYSFY